MIDRQRRSLGSARRAAVAALVAIAASANASARADEPPLPSEPTPIAPPGTTAEPAPAVEPPATAVQPAFVAEPTPANATAPASARTAPTPAPAPAVAIAAPLLKRERHGLALTLGFGLAYSAFGAQARYDIPVRRSLTVSPFVAAGFFGALAGPVGVTAMLGAAHRLAVDLAVAPLGHYGFWLHGTVVDGPLIYGPTAGVGYEHMSWGGWLQRVTFEYAYAAWGSALPIADPHVAAISFAFGWRIW